jgi:ribosome biogenesis GTPase A
MSKHLLLIFSFVLISSAAFSQAQETEAISQAFKAGNAKDLSKFFSNNIELKILNKEDVFSKTQAEIIVKDFFSKNPVKSYTAVHNGTSKAGAQYTIGQLVTVNGTFRTYYFLKKYGDNLMIQELRFEPEE